ncbi:Midasin [Quillaja saponaria]|uniref:Midasin n=1 Tax=Quillaja saponaria TaxID=32244 RepID=A0AAD7PPL5_QUISA|nr:Midasin [Quillaja saponaria]
MAIDGSFSLESSLERFLARCPKLQCFPQFDLLAKRGPNVTEEEVVNVVAEVFLHPKYTIPLMGCFCPIAQKIVDKAIALLRLVPNLRSNSNEKVVEDEVEKVLDEVANVIEYYDRCGRGLNLHELACLAFCRALDLAPFLLGSVLIYFKFAPPPFERLLMEREIPNMCFEVGTCAVQAAQISYRLLIMEPERFCKLWDWSYFLELIKLSANLESGSTMEGVKVMENLKWCAVKILSVVLKMSDTAAASLNVGSEAAFRCLLRWKEFCQDVSLEKASWYVESSDQNELDTLYESMEFNQEKCLQSFMLSSTTISTLQFNEVEPPSRRQRLATWDDISMHNQFLLTSAMKKSFERVLLAVSQKWPVLLYGPVGSGKSALITKLARDSGNQVLSIQMDDQIDGRTLVGGYVCTERPGEFRWQPGSLTQAAQNGFWIVFEDIDRAPSDVHSILLPLLEGANSFVAGPGEETRIAESFRLFCTVSTLSVDASHNTVGGSLSVLWRRVMIGPPSNEDLQSIVKAWYPDLERIVDNIIETFTRVNSTVSHAGSSASGSCLSKFSLRDLLKWCKRITGLDFSFDGGSLSEYQCYCIYKEAVDVFAAFSSSARERSTIMEEIAKLWAVPISVAVTLNSHDKPIIQDSFTDLKIGRVSLQRFQTSLYEQKKPFVGIRSSLHLLERLACSVKYNEPVLLVGETGTGKTTLVQNLALRLGQKLTVLNLSQQSDVADLVGGFKPMDAQFVYFPLYKEFEDLFSKTFSMKKNEDFFAQLRKHLTGKKWRKLLSGFLKGIDFFRKSVEPEISDSGEKRKKLLDEEKIQAWEKFSLKLENVCAQRDASSGVVFSFVEGSFVTALRNGEWILLDEVNLAPPETLQRVIGVLEGENGSLCLAERGDAGYIHRHPNFRIFACMNPATDAGKRDLPFSLRSRFIEYFVDDILDHEDLTLFIGQFINGGHLDCELVNKIACFYKAAKKESDERLEDGANQKPQYSLRSLFRALEYMRKAERKFGLQKALYDGFSMFFLTLLDEPSTKIMNQMILSYLLGGHIPPHVPFDRYLTSKPITYSGNYVLTKSVREHLGKLARAILIKRYPVLLQGPTSSGKTSLVQYLAGITGHEFVRINNHEHTDLQEYLGSYITDVSGKLVFHEGVLVRAVRNGYWIVLDELNLAPSDVLEALNRLLDDNRELFVPELQVTIRAHPDFMLFATQNPPTLYGGRKMLSRAFRNRFVEIYVGEIPENELSTILEKRCEIPESYAKKMVEVMKELQLHRQSSRVFAGKYGFITPRDLFRWADRFRKFGKSYEDLAKDGYYLLAERLRDEDEKLVVQEALERHLRVKLIRNNLYDQESIGGNSISHLHNGGGTESPESVILTKSMRRLCFLVERCFQLREPVLLVGETGGGKTTVCQLLSTCLHLKLHILNCHQYTETSDFLGGFRPVRERSRLMSNYEEMIEQLKKLKAFTNFPEDIAISSDIDQASSTLDRLDFMIRKYKEGQICHPGVTIDDFGLFEKMKSDLDVLHQKWQTIFMWQDGPLVKAMKDGDLLLLDEISLADDSVLERLNSVLEPERKLSLAEKGGSEMEKITAHPNFFVLSTMNPGGDYGKKELSPALRNRFTEIWVPSVSDLDELRDIAIRRIPKAKLVNVAEPSYQAKLSVIVDAMLKFWEWFIQLYPGRMLTVRDLVSWVAFFNVTEASLGPEFAALHGVFLVLLDGISLGTGLSKSDADELRKRCLCFLLGKLMVDERHILFTKLSRLENYGWGDFGPTGDISPIDDMQCDNNFGISPFYIRKGCENCEVGGFEFLAPTTCRNALRVLRAMQLPRPVLLEGSPGVGKTSLIVALGNFSGHRVVRINLSEQTDMMDLLGSDLPVECDEGMKFSWSDGILLQALKEGSWVLLDELNLAPQSVLEGLNAILDHRAEVFIPELGHTYKCPPSFRVFACQNPSHQGGGRKGLPKSFLNRFTKVYIDELVEDDYLFICSSLYPSIPRPLLSKLVLFNKRMHEDTMLHHKFAQDGSPWEFNLRDVIRSCQIIQGAPDNVKEYSFLNILYIQRMRAAADRREVLRLYEDVFEVKPFINPYPRVQVSSKYLVVGNTSVRRSRVQASVTKSRHLKILPGIRQSLEAAAQCLEHQWLCILIGPPSSGKTSLIRLLAQLTGNVLNEINLSSATDISELLGSFEQYDALRNFRSIIARIENYVNEYCSLQLELSKQDFIYQREDLITRWVVFLSSMNYDVLSGSPSVHVENWNRVLSSLGYLLEIIEQIKLGMEKNALPVSWSTKELDDAKKSILKLQGGHLRRPFSTKFEWVMGLLIKAIEQGEWIVLENANLCNPTVLDRINSLVEPSGSITINERGIVDGNPLIVRPHPNFRMFLTVNPNCGEVSRAMRNRGVEIFMMQPNWLLDGRSGYNYEEIELKDVKRFLILSGIPLAKLADSMAKAHCYASHKGQHFDVQITYLELSRWVQLFQQLLRSGNQPMWSLQISWEHIYLSSLGEKEGGIIVRNAKVAYLSVAKLSELDSSLACSLCLPGGWPMPSKLRDFIYYSKEASVVQNCMYLESLGAQYASYEYGVAQNRCSMYSSLDACGYARTYLMDMRTLNQIMFPSTSNVKISDSGRITKCDVEMLEKMILYASNWTLEQATVSDFKLYLLWFSWFSSKLQPFCQVFSYFLTSIKQVMDHPLWNYICCRHRERTCFHEVDSDFQPPLLSLELVDLSASKSTTKLSSKFLCNAINCIAPVRLTYQQWGAESRHDCNDEVRDYLPLLRSLRELEEEILNKFVDQSFMLVESPSFDILIRLYSDLLEDHIQFWHAIISSQLDYLLLSWHSLMKDAGKLREFCPEEVGIFLRVSQNFHKLSSSEKSLLWVHGGHPYMPPSCNLYNKQCQLLKLGESVWPTKTVTLKQGATKSCLIDLIASCNPELKFRAMEGFSMLLSIMEKCGHDDDDAPVVEQLEDVYQMLVRRFEHEKHNLQMNTGYKEFGVLEESSAACCTFTPDILCTISGFNSWQDTLPLVDRTSLFWDMELLQELQSIFSDNPEGLQCVFGLVSKLVDSAMKFSLTLSSRAPQMFLPHQKILWTMNAWTTVEGVNAKTASFVLEMWFRWHQSLWILCPESIKSFSKIEGHSVVDVSLPCMLIQPVNTATIWQIMQSPLVLKDYFVHRLKFRVTSCNLWISSHVGAHLPSFLLSAARSLFQQIIYAHKRSFDAGDFVAIKSYLQSFQKNSATEESIQLVSNLIASSRHRRLKQSVHVLIVPLLRQLYLHCTSADHNYNLGRAWLWIGGLRFHLLLSNGDIDPAMKYYCEYSQIVEKISSLELEIQVRQECEYLSGQNSTAEADKRREQILENLHAERQKLQRKIVFRPDHRKFMKLKNECDEFLKVVTNLEVMLCNIEAMDLQYSINQVYNWQETASCFIDRLMDEYDAYNDIIQPIQVSIYEMKLGLSLVLSGTLQKAYLSKIGLENMDLVMETIYTVMRFPRGASSKSISVNYNNGLNGIPSYNVDFAADFHSVNMGLLENLVALSNGTNSDKTVSVMQIKASILQNILVLVAHSVANAKLMDKQSFLLLEKIFNEFASLWMSMKDQAKTKSDYNAQQYKFKPRGFKIESIIEVDISTLGKLYATDTFSEWKELLCQEESTETKETTKDYEISEEEWKLLDDTNLSNVVVIHDHLFGSNDLSQTPGNFQVSDADCLLSFTNSYTLGVDLIKGLGNLVLSSLDAKLVPEHLLHLCLDYGRKFISSHKSSTRYNFYKDSNDPVMARMLEALAPLQKQVISLLNEWQDDHDLRKVVDVIDMLLTIPSSTPLAKALSGLQFLLHKCHALQESGSKFSLSQQLEAIVKLVNSWHKVESDSWPALLDEVQDQCESNAGKLWFPLYSVLQDKSPAAHVEYCQSTIESLEDFIQTSSIGEYRKRLQLLFAFLGQTYTSGSLASCLSPFEIYRATCLYNLFGFYVQFLPMVLEHIEDSRKKIETELKDLMQLCRWEQTKSYLFIEKSKRARQKLRKLIQKYTEVLQQPVMLLLNQDAAKKGINALSLHSNNVVTGFLDNSLSSAELDQRLIRDENRSLWFDECSKKVYAALQNLQLKKISVHDIMSLYSKNPEVVGSTTSPFSSSQPVFLAQEGWKAVWYTVENVYKTAIHCGDIWKETKKGQGKRRALSDLLKLLESSGLSRHKAAYGEGQLKNWWFVQPSNDVQYLLLTQSRLSSGVFGVHSSYEIEILSHESPLTEWKSATEYYFKSVASVLLLQKICLNPHKSITREQVDRASSFATQLIEMQQKQLVAANCFDKDLKRLSECVSTLEKLYSHSPIANNVTVYECSILPEQYATFKCMWQQKQLFDSLCAITYEELLLLRTFKESHSNTCQAVQASVSKMLACIEEYLPVFSKSKELLNYYLIGQKKGITAVSHSSYPYIVTKQMEQLVSQNFLTIKDFEVRLRLLRLQNVERSSVKDVLLCHLEEVIKKARVIEEELNSAVRVNYKLVDPVDDVNMCNDKCSDSKGFDEAVKGTFEHIENSLQHLFSSSDLHAVEESMVNITSWEFLFHTFASNLGLDSLSDMLLKTIVCGEKLVNHTGNEICCHSSKVGEHFRHLHLSMDLILNFGNELLKNFLAMHRAVSTTTYVIANVLASLYSEGYGTSGESEADDETLDTSKDASGTGMGEGTGLKDVSDQITDEDQLLGTDEQPSEKHDTSSEVPNKNAKGVEMEQDIDADTFSVSEDSEEDNNQDDEEEKQLDTEMGPTGTDSEVVDEKLWNKEEGEIPNNGSEKHEVGPSVTDRDRSNRELRAKDDGDAAADEPGELNLNEVDEQIDEIGSQEDIADKEDSDDMNKDKNAPCSDPTEMRLDELDQNPDDEMDLDEREDTDSMEKEDPEDQGESAENGKHEEEGPCPTDEIMAEGHNEQVGGTPEREDLGRDREENAEMDSLKPQGDVSEAGFSDLVNDHVSDEKLASQSKGDWQTSDPKHAAPESNWSRSSTNDPALLGGLPSKNMSDMDFMVADASNNGGITNSQPNNLSQQEQSFGQENQPNPYRNLGSALEEWKEKVKIYGDIQADNMEVQDKINDENAEEYGYVSELEKGTAQAIGPATSDQIDRNIDGNKGDEDSLPAQKDVLPKMQFDKQNLENPIRNSASSLKNETVEQLKQLGLNKSVDEGSIGVGENENGYPEKIYENLVSLKKSYLSKGIHKPSELSMHDNDLGKAEDPAEVSNEVKDNATALWRRYEMSTTKLSQELAEQLRLVMEPTVASKLQGDYRTGKRINMKKVIPYIASHYRKDKIWLRRTRPNKRDYQVVIAVDDSRSMSESRCGSVAVESLVTVCRAVSQLEMGNLAVASFGTKGNIKLLHDFDRPFTGEAGVKMISNLTFKQENTIADEPVVDLLKYLNEMLDTAVAKARLPSGQNPLQQLVLIIADGRFHEKENLKHCVRDVLTGKRLVAFLLLDSPEESIMDVKEASFESGNIKFSSYMDSFPFPYYILLRNIEALPRTLADLLRQWFELTQYSRD